MRRVAVTLGMVAAVALANPAGAAVLLPHDFFHEPAPSPPVFGFGANGNLPHGFGPISNDALGGGIRPFDVPVAPGFDAGDDQNGSGLGGNDVPLFDIRFDPGHDFYNSLSAQIIAPSVPESSTWMMLLLGFAAVGFMTRRAVSALPVASAS